MLRADRPAWGTLALCNVPILGLLAVASATVGLGEAVVWGIVLVVLDGIIIRRWLKHEPPGA